MDNGIKETFEVANKYLDKVKKEMLQLGFKIEWFQNLTYIDNKSPIYSYQFKGEFSLTDSKKENEICVLEYLEKINNILSKYYEYNPVIDSSSGTLRIMDSKILDKECNIWGMVFDDSKPYIFIQANIVLNKKLASKYKQEVLGQSSLIGTKPIKYEEEK